MDIDLNVAHADNTCNAPADLQEEWRDIKDPRLVPGKYQVSNLGRIRNVETGKILKMSVPKKAGYRIAVLPMVNDHTKRVGLYVHRVVASIFLPSPQEAQTQVDHIDGDRLNNRVDNLRWVTPQENNRNPITRQKARLSVASKAAKTFKPVMCIETGEIFPSVNAAAAAYNLKPCSITNSCRVYSQTDPTRWRPIVGGRAVRHFKYVPVEYDDAQLNNIDPETPAYNAKRVRCIEDDIIFPSLHAAARAYHLSVTRIQKACIASAANAAIMTTVGTKQIKHFEWAD